jgi:transglutaminase-like putative cysteine protease
MYMTIDRRSFLAGTAAFSALSILPARFAAAAVSGALGPHPELWREFEITTRIDVLAPEGVTKAWIPLPGITATDWIQPLGDQSRIEGGKAERLQVGAYGAAMLVAEWPAGTEMPFVEVISRVATRDRSLDLTKPDVVSPLSHSEQKLFTAPTKLIPTDGIVKKTSDEITTGATTDLEKARRIYEWVVTNTFRDPKTQGCGLGDISFMLQTGDLGGKCADINGLFVGLARAAGLPARDLYGIRVAPSQRGYKSLGANSEVITKAQHCRAEVHLSGFGWVPVDPADVRKVALEEPPGNLAVDSEKVATARQTLFGAWETNWIAYNQAHDVVLPGSNEPAIGFLMYPQIETAAGHRDCLDPDACKYTITAKTITA